jgi:hypothetical protein
MLVAQLEVTGAFELSRHLAVRRTGVEKQGGTNELKRLHKGTEDLLRMNEDRSNLGQDVLIRLEQSQSRL